MALLLYKSNEMFSSTELIRKSKMIFDKVLGKKIEKAIILRDGKPSFLLMEFSKYEKIMAEYEELKEYVEQIKDGTAPKKRVKPYKVKEKKNNKEKAKKAESEKLVEKTEPNQNKDMVENLSEKEEIDQAYSSIDSMNIDDDKKEKAKEKIKAKILEARKEREKIELEDPNQKIAEKELENQIAKEKLKKEQELEEFWD